MFSRLREREREREQKKKGVFFLRKITVYDLFKKGRYLIYCVAIVLDIRAGMLFCKIKIILQQELR